MNLTRRYWPDGWIPSDDEINGRATGLVRMDNLNYDEMGVLSLSRGTRKINATEFPFTVHTVYSKYIAGTRHRFVSLSDATVRHSTGSSFTTLLTGGSATRTAFVSALSHVFIFSGNARKKFDGTTTTDITPAHPETAPVVVEAAKNDFVFINTDFSGFVLVAGTDLDTSITLTFKTTETDGIVQLTPSPAWDTMSLGAGGTGQPTDQFLFFLTFDKPRNVKSVRVTFLLDDSPEPINNFYWYQWDNVVGSEFFDNSENSISVFKALRQDFQLASTDEVAGWSSVKAWRISIVTDAVVEVTFHENSQLFVGFNENPMTGLYDYIQVNVNDTGSYIAKSKASPSSKTVQLENGRALITPVAPTDPQVNEIWFYRRSAEWRQDVRSPREPIKLDRWYRVKILEAPFNPFEDFTSDDDALLENVTYRDGLESVTLWTDDEILMATEMFQGRMFLMGVRDIYITTEDDFGLYAPFWTLRTSGDSTEKNLWIRKVGNNQILVGTTHDIYEISGTCLELPDGTLDLRLATLGIEYPPIHEAHAVDSNTVFFIASDGVRALSGSTSIKISGNLDLLFQGYTRHGISPIDKVPNNNGLFSIAISKGKLWFLARLVGGARRIFVYDIKAQLWWFWTQNPLFLYCDTKEDDILIAGYGLDMPGFIKELYIDNNIDGEEGQTIFFQTISDDNNQPRNRKDTFTLKITADSGNLPVNLQLERNDEGFVNLGNFSFNGSTEYLIDVSALTLGFRYTLQISGSNLTQFKLYHYTLEYDPRPEQLNYLRIQNDNLGYPSRKRLITYPFVIDTLGNNITFTPILDGASGISSTVNINRKGTYLHYFLTETIATDVGGILSGGTFEFYQPLLNEAVSEKLPALAKFLVIPANDYGTPNRKRHSSYKFNINTLGLNVRFTPILDGVSYPPLTFSTVEKRTVEYFFSDDTIAIDIGGELESLTDTPFEFYGVIVPQQVEVLPPRLEEFWIPENNYGVPARKRIRTMPMEINTNGANVTFIPRIDGVSHPTPTVFNTPHRMTVLHYFTDDQFGIDFSGELIGGAPFEFYGLHKPIEVEILPVGKRFDQVGPVPLDRIGRFLGFRVQMVCTGTYMNWRIIMEDETVHEGSFTTEPNKNKIYEVMNMPKTLLGTVKRIELGGPLVEVFHRYWIKARVTLTGIETNNVEIPLE